LPVLQALTSFACHPAEHIRLPDRTMCGKGLLLRGSAAHAADIAKGIPGALEKDRKMAQCRKNLDWEGQISLSFDPEKVRAWRGQVPLAVKRYAACAGNSVP